MPVIGERVTVSTTATVILDPANGGVVDKHGAIIKLPSTAGASVFLGGSGVTTTTGYELEVGDIVDVSLVAGDVLYGIVAASTEDVHVLRDRS